MLSSRILIVMKATSFLFSSKNGLRFPLPHFLHDSRVFLKSSFKFSSYTEKKNLLGQLLELGDLLRKIGSLSILQRQWQRERHQAKGLKSRNMAGRKCYKSLNCLNNKMLKSDWFLKALIYGLIWLLQHQNCPI